MGGLFKTTEKQCYTDKYIILYVEIESQWYRLLFNVTCQVRSISAIFNDKNDLLAVKTMEVHHGSVMDLWVEICHVGKKEMMDLIRTFCLSTFTPKIKFCSLRFDRNKLSLLVCTLQTLDINVRPDVPRASFVYLNRVAQAHDLTHLSGDLYTRIFNNTRRLPRRVSMYAKTRQDKTNTLLKSHLFTIIYNKKISIYLKHTRATLKRVTRN